MWLTSIKAYGGLAKTRPPTPFPQRRSNAHRGSATAPAIFGGKWKFPFTTYRRFLQGQVILALLVRPFPLPGGPKKCRTRGLRAAAQSLPSPPVVILTLATLPTRYPNPASKCDVICSGKKKVVTKRRIPSSSGRCSHARFVP